MTFAWPQLLWLLLVPAALLWWELAHRRLAAARTRPKILRAEAGPRSLTLASAESAAARADRNTRPRIWLCAGLAFALAALARPQWGRLEEPVFDQSREILIAIDLSRSMLTPDIKPSRLDRAKLLIQSLLEKLEGERVGLVVFSGTAFLQCPLSADYEILREFLPALSPEFLPQGGSNYRALLQASIEAFGNASTADRFLIALSDGEATEDDWRPLMEQLKERNIRVIGLGIGTTAGAMIPDGSGGFVKDERGAVVLSKLESGTLQELAQSTRGTYRDASTWVDLAALLQETVERGREGEFVEKNTVHLVERFQWPLAVGLWCLLFSFCYEFPVRPRPRDVRLTTENGKQKTAGPNPKQAAPAMASALVLLFSVFCLPSSADAAVKLANPPTKSAEPEPSAIGKLVGRLSATDDRSARDWAELARETVTWGLQLKSAQNPVPEGPVRDALSAVDLGSKLDAKTADWPKLREELEALLQKPEDQKQQQQQQQNKDQQQQDQQNQDQQKQDPSSPQDQKQSDPQQSPSEQKNSPPQDQQSKQPENQPTKPEEQKSGEEKSPPPPQPSSDTQKVGGAQDKNEQAKEPADPALAVPMQKLDRLRTEDSPAQLFQRLEGNPNPDPKKKPTKDW